MIHSVGINTPTPLPNESFKPISLAASEMLSFYVTFASRCGTMRYGIGIKEGNVAISNQDLSILEGCGNYYPFRNTLAPRVWSGSILYALQDSLVQTMKPTKEPIKKPTKIPTKLKMSRLATTFSGGSGLSGCMFSIKATRALKIQAMDINTSNKTGIPIELWTMKGSYIGYESKNNAWTKILSTIVTGAGLHRVTRLGSNFPTVDVGASQVISFYVTSTTSQPLMSSPGSKVNNQYSANNDLMIMEGTGLSYPFGKQISPKVCNVAILYI
jgi:hypothetical protein